MFDAKKTQQYFGICHNRFGFSHLVYSICISLGTSSGQPLFYQISNLHATTNYQKLFIPYEKLSNLRNIDLDYSRIMSGNVHHRTPFWLDQSLSVSNVKNVEYYWVMCFTPNLSYGVDIVMNMSQLRNQVTWSDEKAHKRLHLFKWTYQWV